MNSTTIKDIKQQFFAYRNGMLAESLRQIEDYDIIFGLQVPQLAEIARSLEPSVELAEALWNDRHVRESRLLAAYLFPPGDVTPEMAVELAAGASNQEEADMLAFRIFKRLDFAASLPELFRESQRVKPYTIKTLENHLS